MSGLSFSHAVAQTLWHDKLFHIDLNAQRIGKFDQDFRFGSEGIRDAFYVVKLLEDAGWDGMRHFDAHPYRTEDADGVWDFARGCMRTYLILAEKARRFHEDPEIQEALRAAKVAELAEPTAPGRRPRRAPRRRGYDEDALAAAGLRPRAPRPARHRTAARGPLVPLVVGVDSSTSACKVQVRDVDTGAVVASGRAAHPPTSPPRSEQHPADWERAFHAACAEAGVPDAHAPAAIAVAAQQHGLVVLGARRRGPAAGQALERHRVGTRRRDAPRPPCRVGRRAGPPPAAASPSPSFTITKLHWLRRCEPETLRRDALPSCCRTTG